MIGVDPLGHTPVIHGHALKKIKVHIKSDAKREEGEFLTHHTLYILLNGTELYLSYMRWEKKLMKSKTK